MIVKQGSKSVRTDADRTHQERRLRIEDREPRSSILNPQGKAHGGNAGQIVLSVRDLVDMLGASSAASGTQIVAKSRAMHEVIEQAKCFAPSMATVLIEGESGTGKELVARMIHDFSPRSGNAYVAVNCAALSESLVESELFGHEQGAFTGAVTSRPGKFEFARGGTLLLDEVGEIPFRVQAKLLRVLEEKEFQRVGGNKTYTADVRVIAATNRSLAEEVRDGRFRADLYYRLDILRIMLPPLRERPEDIPALVAYFIRQLQSPASVPVRGVAQETLQTLARCGWPGNVRQLRNFIERACLLTRTGILQPSDLPELHSPTTDSLPEDYEELTLAEIERRVILSTLRKYHGNKSAAARHLGVTARTLFNKVKQYREMDQG